jgi:hypothetical protein
MSVFKRFLFLPLLAFSLIAFGQAASSPFSTLGIGEPFGNNLIQNHGMGGTGVSQPQFWSINNANPALLVFNYLTSFQAGSLIESRKISSDTSSQKSINGNLTYLVTAFPIKTGKWTTSVGLMPFTRVNYKVAYQQQIFDNTTVVDTADITEQGTGGLNQVYWAHGVRVHKNWSVGVKAAYIFGSINNDFTNSLINSNQALPFAVGVKEQTYIKDFKFSGGLSFSKDSIFGDNYRISAGALYNFSTNLKADKTTVIQRRYSTGTPLSSDTINIKGGSIEIPSSFTAGVSISKGTKWSAAMEFSAQNWKNFKSLNAEDEVLDQSWSISMGGELTPDMLAFSNYLKRITYRVGFSYEKTPFRIENPDEPGKFSDLKDFGINFGLSLPTGRSSLDLGLRLGKRGDKSVNVLEETYYKIYFGITFNDQWFIRRRFD